MIDLVLKIQGKSPVPKGSFEILPQGQFDVASALKGKERLSSKQITESLGCSSGKVSTLLNIMCSRGIVKKNKVANRTTKAYLFSLAIENFELKGAA